MGKFYYFIIRHYIRGGGVSLFSINAKLSFFGVFIGTSLLVVVLSIFSGFPKQLKDSIFRFDPHLVIMKEGQKPIKKWRELKERVAKLITVDVSRIEGMVESPAIMRFRREIDHVFLRAREFDEDPADSKKYLIPDDFPLNEEGATIRSFPKGNYCFIGSEMGDLYGLDIGDKIEVIVPRGHYDLKAGVEPSMKTLKIAGYFKTGNYEYDTKAVIFPLKSAQSLYKTGDRVRQVMVRLKNIDDLERAEDELFYGLPADYSVRTIEQQKRNVFTAVKMEKTIMVIIVSLFILAAMVGLMVSIFQVVRSRKKDIGILKALGLSDFSVLLIFTLIGFSFGVMGTFLGITFGIFLAVNLESIINSIEIIYNTIGQSVTGWFGSYWSNVELVPKNIYYFDSLPVSIERDFLLVLGILAILISGLASLIPAWYAGKMEPVDIIRGAEQ
ncbi:MAG: ABC transporter permease [Leptospirales bacterium]